MTQFLLVLASGSLLLGCAKRPPTAIAVCAELDAKQVATHCRSNDERHGITGSARQIATFDLRSATGKTGQVLTFATEKEFDAAVAAFAALGALSGPHRYGARGVLVFVQMNENATEADGQAVKAVLEKYE